MLWLVASPTEIAEEFGDRAKSPRTIYRRFEKLGISGLREHRKRFRQKLMTERAHSLKSERQIKKEVDEILFEERENAYFRIWRKIEDFEGRFDADI